MQRPSPMPAFAAVTLTAPALIALGALWGGGWAVAALLWMTVLTLLLDEFVAWVLPTAEGDEFPSATALSITLALAHGGIWLLVIRALGDATTLPLWERIAVFLSAGMFMGQVSNSNAHELIHRSNRTLRRIGRWLYISVLFGHHSSAHPLVHHIHVGTPNDPNTARLGESFYRFFPRAWIGSFRKGLQAETQRLTRVGRPLWRHPYVTYIAGALLMLLMATLIGGLRGLVIALLLGGYAQMQLMMSDYVQHYGLQRRRLPSGKYEPVQAEHSWNAPHPMSSALMLNAPRHSDHHIHPTRPYPALTLTDDLPMLPHSLPAMATFALWPRIWRRVMDHRAAKWRASPDRSGQMSEP